MAMTLPKKNKPIGDTDEIITIILPVINSGNWEKNFCGVVHYSPTGKDEQCASY